MKELSKKQVNDVLVYRTRFANITVTKDNGMFIISEITGMTQGKLNTRTIVMFTPEEFSALTTMFFEAYNSLTDVSKLKIDDINNLI